MSSIVRSLHLSPFPTFPPMQTAPVIGVALWILGEYCEENELMVEAFQEVRWVSARVALC